ncbi:HD domain-containing protein [Streptomyces sp. NPDC055078]
MARQKALLIGASEYDDPAIPSLPFVKDDLQRLAAALAERGFHSVDVAEPKRVVTPNFVDGQISRFLRAARASDTLLILLSGHGHSFEGEDYLIPEDADFAISPFAEGCVRIGWKKELEACEAAQIVFLIDACREGLERDSMAPGGTRSWSRRKVAATLRRKVAYVYACSSSQVALYVRPSDTVRNGDGDNRDGGGGEGGGTAPGAPSGDSFSLFSRAVCDIAVTRPHAVDLAEFESAVQDRVRELHTAYGKTAPLQRIKVISDIRRRDLTVLPGPARSRGEHPWKRAVATHPVWNRTDPALAATTDALRTGCVALTGRLADGYERVLATALRDDPWHDRELPGRVHDRAGFITGKLADDTVFSPAEAALLAVLPFLDAAFWAREAARRVRVLDRDPPADAADDGGFREFREFLRQYPRLERRLFDGERPMAGARPILWWAFHRWLLRQPDAYTLQALGELLGRDGAEGPDGLSGVDGADGADGADGPPGTDSSPGADSSPGTDGDDRLRRVLNEHRLLRFVQDRRMAPFAEPRPGTLKDDEVIAPTTVHEHTLHETLVACLSKAAHALAVDPVELPDVVADHLGISDSVDLDALHTTLRESRWTASGSGRSLHAVCRHPAVELALQGHASRVDALLRALNRLAATRGSALCALATLPAYANADRVRQSWGAPAGLSAGIRFHLAEDRVQRLLMGEELYGESGLAIRELYQNALDACRYRLARTEYLRRTTDESTGESAGEPDGEPDRESGGEPGGWAGRISFTEGEDKRGRRYLDCEDNGVGMGVRELSGTFAQAGARFVDLPEFVEEQAEWLRVDPSLVLYPNSRFGIGVLSYFMLADEITVHTCRMERDGRLGRRLKVTIAGPGNLFRIEDLGPGRRSGTRVRLHLGSWVEPGRTVVDHLVSVLVVAEYLTTAKDAYAEARWEPGVPSPEGFAGEPGAEGLDAVATRHPDLWWHRGPGRLLSDGLAISHTDGGPPVPWPPHGVIVNLRGPHRPELTVDRRRVRKYDDTQVERRFHSAVPDLIRDGAALVTREWLTALGTRWPDLADAVTEEAGRAGLEWDALPLPYRTTGFFAPDLLLAPLVTGDYDSPAAHFQERNHELVRTLPEEILHWRLLALHAAAGLLAPGALSGDGPAVGLPGDGPAVGLPGGRPPLAALPSDLVLLGSGGAGIADWEKCFADWSGGPGFGWSGTSGTSGVSGVSGAGWSGGPGFGRPGLPGFGRSSPYGHQPSQRLATTGWPSIAGLYHWRRDAEVSVADVFGLMARTRRTAGQVADRLTALGQPPPALGAARAAVPADAPVLEPIPGCGWLLPGARVPRILVFHGAERRGHGPASVARRLGQLGYDVDASSGYPAEVGKEARLLLAELRQRRGGPDERLTPGHVAIAALRTHQPFTRVLRTAALLGVPAPGHEQMRTLDRSDKDLLRLLALHGVVDGRVSRAALVSAALGLGQTPEAVAARAVGLGLEVPSPVPGPDWLGPEFSEVVVGQAHQLPDDAPVPPRQLAALARDTRLPPAEVTDRLRALGYAVQEPRRMPGIRDGDWALIRGTPIGDRLTPDALYAAARHTRRPPEEIVAALGSLGLPAEPLPAAFEDDIAAEAVVSDALAGHPAGGAPGGHPSGGALAGAPISLRALASAAMRHRTTFRAAAGCASRLGMRYPAEGWFSA